MAAMAPGVLFEDVADSDPFEPFRDLPVPEVNAVEVPEGGHNGSRIRQGKIV